MTPTFADIQAAAERIKPYAIRTPLVESWVLNAEMGTRVFLKLETLQRTGSFKFRGALHKLLRSLDAAREHGVIAYSSGNHGQAVACAAQLLGCRCTVVMPEGGVREKQEGVLSYGGEIVLAPEGSDARKAMAEQRAAAEGLVLVPPYDDYEIMAGQGSVGLEIAEALPGVRQVLVPVGGGGLLAGTAIALKALLPAVRLIAVEPAGASDFWQSLRSGERVSLPRVDTAADGLRTQSVGERNWPVLKALVDEVVTVSEDEILAGVRSLLWREKLVVEPSGAVTYAAFLAGHVAQDVPSVAVLSGGNIARTYLQQVLG